MAQPALSQPQEQPAQPVAEVPAQQPAVKVPETVAWVCTTYFAEGLPYMIVQWLSGVYATAIGLPESVIGGLNALNIPWNFKFVWAPLLDWVGTKRGWLFKLQLAIAAACGLLALLVGLGPQEKPAKEQHVAWSVFAHTIDPHTHLSHLTIIGIILGLFALLAVLSATNDVAIDAFYIAGLPNRTDQAAYSGLRVTAYRVAMLFAKAALIGYSLFAYGFAVAAGVMGALALFHAFALPQFEKALSKEDRPPFLQHLQRAFWSFLDQPRIGVILLFILCYKLGDALLFAMNSTFLLRELKLSMAQFKFVSAWVATPTAIVGTMFGAWLIKRYGLKTMAWPLTIAMSVTIWAYIWLAWTKPDPNTAAGLHAIWAVHGYEQVAAALGDAVLTLFIVYTCKPEFKAAHFAIGSAIMSLGGTVLRSFSGVMVMHLGYTKLYILAFILSLPAMALLPFVPIERETGR